MYGGGNGETPGFWFDYCAKYIYLNKHISMLPTSANHLQYIRTYMTEVAKWKTEKKYRSFTTSIHDGGKFPADCSLLWSITLDIY